MSVLQGDELQDLWSDFFVETYQGSLVEAAEILDNGDYRDTVPIEISYQDVKSHNKDMAFDLVEHPTKMLAGAKDAITTQPEYSGLASDPVTIRVNEMPVVGIREVTHQQLGSLVTVSGIVKEVTDPKPRFEKVAFECQRCGTLTEINQTQDSLKEPNQCRGCEREGPFSAVLDHSDYIYHQRLRVQESPEGLQGGEDPRELDVHVEGDLVDTATPGDKARITGIVTHPDPFEQSGSSDNPLVDLYIDANNIFVSDGQVELDELSESEISEIKKVANSEDAIEKFVDSIAPSVHGNRIEKTAIALQMLSGVRKPLDDKTIRGDIHIALVGDPGTAKSQLLQFTKSVMPRSAFTTGENSSKVGLTAAAVQSDLGGTSRWSVEGGALVLADEGIACIDELDKLDEDMDALHTALEQQQVTVTKAGMNTTMNARCGVLAAANPKYGRWERHDSILEQVDIPPALLSRFDLIFKLEDRPDEEFDSELAGTILRTNKAGEKVQRGRSKDDIEEIEEVPLTMDLLPKYIMYAREAIDPVLTESAEEKLQSFYVSTRVNGMDETKDTVPITARKLEASVRLAEASARARLSETIEDKDAELAIDLIRTSLEQVGTDPETNEFDADMIETGMSATQRDRIRSIREVIDSLVEESDDALAEYEEIVDIAMDELGVDEQQVQHEIDKLKSNGELYEPKTGHLRTT